ncbi:UDP-2,4-diacetamido-2,4,6-trideoxy-beta-L-altropyranose hydrolase [Rhodoplanes sp. Z2-YC6860]|uniref:UDP-2,4-diacetamido-2,4, 6-trideoxy-beta-L-altropyranose hydrolase n=1 Tax=Rhodoplanes sp. Z2-YC6860 TaxID=674703 RepID=UPI00078CC7E2|nr:UDP-2,4-diacetamido-2,4,6-trideoxy-beta-L-altropyranose hydrolase [Rhodoplanes sp. Z2-YC6860]AMN43455.1 pseudaminic acid biosynthesis-associated protein PseG [Rhodoplanes sp. Z2-YC6860]
MTAYAVFRCDASPAIGGGHVMRCLAFAETLALAGWSIGFVTRRDGLAAVPALAASGHAIVDAEGNGQAQIEDRATLVVVDHYGLDAKFEAAVKRQGRTVVVFDDLADRAHDCVVLVDPTPGRAASDYAGKGARRLLLGGQHAIIRREWQQQRAEAVARLATGGAVKRIIVSMGATDPIDATSKVLAALALAKLDADVDVVVGAGAPHLESVRKQTGARVSLHVGPGNLPALTAAADLAIGAPGTSSFERALLGLPAILIPTADNQRFNAAAFAASGAAEVLTADILDQPAALAAKIEELAADRARRTAMSRAASATTDGRGAQRLMAVIAGRWRTSDGSEVSLRLADAADSDWLLKLQSKPQTRRFARHASVPSIDEHKSWVSATLGNPDRMLMIIEAERAPIGMLRLDRVAADAPTYEVSIAIDPDWHRRGVGLAALSLARRVVPGADILATVLPGNEASAALFKAAGYQFEAPERLRSRAA